ncbi:MAG: lysophospholipid acyltransferase family protein [Proteobacteria bacterium]|nr:lysophospholipid acyltransferase family protein [Pseudomonadota bacterium]
MKQVLRSAAVQTALGWLLGGYIRLILRTVRWRHHNLEALTPVLQSETGILACFWHGRIPLCMSTAPQWWTRRTRALISPSADGQFIATALEINGFPAVRGSSAKPGDSAKTRQAALAFREALNWLKGGGCLIVTPDGPRGPNEVLAEGAAQLAKKAGTPVFLMGIAAAPASRLKGWDRQMWALPFGRGAVVWAGPFHVGAETTAAQAALEWSVALAAATRQAEALVG